jgi:hypothetical protein
MNPVRCYEVEPQVSPPAGQLDHRPGAGTLLTVLTLRMMTMIGTAHPAMGRGEQDDRGTAAATNFGAMPPIGGLMGHLVYGAVLGLGYAAWPIG